MQAKNYAIIVAGGKGNRMQSDVPKQFLVLAGKPVLMHTIEAFSRSDYQPEIILTLNESLLSSWQDLCDEYAFQIPHRVVAGGEERFHSVKNALALINENGLVAIHDAVRPCINQKLIDSTYAEAENNGSAVLAIKSRDSVRQKTTAGSASLNRDTIYLVQTPQTFQTILLKSAYEADFQTSFTDDASVVEQAGNPISIVEGELTNIKITFPEDIAIAEVYLNKKSP